jgi:hypothetical protein
LMTSAILNPLEAPHPWQEKFHRQRVRSSSETVLLRYQTAGTWLTLTTELDQ